MIRRRAFIAAALAVSLFATGAAYAQQMTRVAVIDLVRVYDAYSTDSAAARAFEDDRAKVQAQLDRMKAEISDIQKRKADAAQAGKSDVVSQLDKELAAKLKNLKDYLTGKTVELEEKKRKLLDSSEFARSVYETVQRVAESEGFSVVFTTTGTDSVANPIIWYSPLIDITDKVIASLSR